MELIPHRPTARLTRARASSLEMVLTRPLRTSSRRRKASAAQSCRAKPSSEGSRLSTRRSARSARASLGRESASSAICSTVMLMPREYRPFSKPQLKRLKKTQENPGRPRAAFLIRFRPPAAISLAETSEATKHEANGGRLIEPQPEVTQLGKQRFPPFTILHILRLL
jgi:hypothetical protein